MFEGLLERVSLDEHNVFGDPVMVVGILSDLIVIGPVVQVISGLAFLEIRRIYKN